MIAGQIFDQHVIFHGRDGQNPPGTAKAMSMRQVTVDFAMRTLTESGSVDLWGDTQMSEERRLAPQPESDLSSKFIAQFLEEVV